MYKNSNVSSLTSKLSKLFCHETLDDLTPKMAITLPLRQQSGFVSEVVLGEESEGSRSPREKQQIDSDGFVRPRNGYFPVKTVSTGPKLDEKIAPQKRKGEYDIMPCLPEQQKNRRNRFFSEDEIHPETPTTLSETQSIFISKGYLPSL